MRYRDGMGSRNNIIGSGAEKQGPVQVTIQTELEMHGTEHRNLVSI